MIQYFYVNGATQKRGGGLQEAQYVVTSEKWVSLKKTGEAHAA